MRRSVAAVFGIPMLMVGLLAQHPLAVFAIAGSGLVLTVHAATGAGPKPMLPLPAEVAALVAAGATATAIVGVVAYLI